LPRFAARANRLRAAICFALGRDLELVDLVLELLELNLVVVLELEDLVVALRFFLRAGLRLGRAVSEGGGASDDLGRCSH
jgi:hypothetical protein